jgi:protein-tyrosine-phosphatase
MRVLFICKHNRFRSKVAEALFKKYNKNKQIKAESAGIDLDYILVAENVIEALKEFGINKVNRKPRKISKELINNSDLIVIVANNINKNMFKNYKKKIIVWKISDTNQDNYKGILKRTKLIEKRIKNLVSMLK